LAAVVGVIAPAFVKIEIQALDQQAPEILMDEIPFLISVKARPLKVLFQQGIFLKPCPQHGEIIEDIQFRQVKTLAAFNIRQVLEKIDDLALPGCRTTNKDESIESASQLFNEKG